MDQQPQRTLADMVFVGFNRQVVALDRYTGELLWTWKAPQGSGYVAVLVDGDRLIVSSQGYTYCLEPIFGQEVWQNPLQGLGVGIPCIASLRGSTGPFAGAVETHHLQQQSATTAAAAS